MPGREAAFLYPRPLLTLQGTFLTHRSDHVPLHTALQDCPEPTWRHAKPFTTWAPSICLALEISATAKLLQLPRPYLDVSLL